MNDKQRESRTIVIMRFDGEPDNEYDWGKVHFMVYDNLHIGIEIDGYIHS